MSSPKRRDAPKLPASVSDLKPNDRLALAATLIGIVVVALGLTLESYFGGLGTGIRALGGVIFLIGISTFVLGDARRRAAVQSKLNDIVTRYVARTAHWSWPDRWGLAADVDVADYVRHHFWRRNCRRRTFLGRDRSPDLRALLPEGRSRRTSSFDIADHPS